MALRLQLQVACAAGDETPDAGQVESWAAAALKKIGRDGGELTVRVVGITEMADLNHRYRQKPGPTNPDSDQSRPDNPDPNPVPTNVLSFPFNADGLPLDILGDVVVCAPLVASEAASRGQPLMEHWAHLVIHGTLHLCGFDHQQDDEAERMESLERDILAELGIAYPWAAS